MANVPWPALFLQHLQYLIPLSPPPGVFSSRLSHWSAEAVFTCSFGRSGCTVWGTGCSAEYCIRFQFSPRWSSHLVLTCSARWVTSCCSWPEEVKTVENCVTSCRNKHWERNKTTFSSYRDAGGPLAIESLLLEVWLSKECALSSLGMHGLILLTIKGRWRPDDPLGLYLPRWDQSSSWTFTLHGVKFYSLTMEKLKLVSVRLVLFHCSFLESQLKNCTCSMTIQQCLQKCSSVKLKSFCLR